MKVELANCKLICRGDILFLFPGPRCVSIFLKEFFFTRLGEIPTALILSSINCP
jgi:hypothetical protein